MNTKPERKTAGHRTGRLIYLLLVLLPIVIFPPQSRAAGKTQPIVTVQLTPDTLLVGDRLHCTIDVRHPASEVSALELAPPDTLSERPFELISRKQPSAPPIPGIGHEIYELEFAVFGSGRQLLPPFTVIMRNSEGKESQRVSYKPSTSVFVQALTDTSMHDLRPIKPPLKPSIPILLLMPIMLGAIAAALVALLLLFILKRTVSKSAEKIDPGHVAQRKLRKLGSRLSAGMPPPECYEELSNIMRSFLEHHYRIRALEAVTQEIERDLKKLGVAGFESIMNLLKQADLVKFADSRPDVEESRQSLHKATEVIRSTRITSPPEE